MPQGTTHCPLCNQRLNYSMPFDSDGITISLTCTNTTCFNYGQRFRYNPSESTPPPSGHATLPSNSEQSLSGDSDIITCGHCSRSYPIRELAPEDRGEYRCLYCGRLITKPTAENPLPETVGCKNCGASIARNPDNYCDRFFYCDNCIRELFIRCSVCNRMVKRGRAHTHSGESYCSDCFNEKYTTCCQCGDYVLASCVSIYGDDNYCEDCYANNFTTCDECGENCPNADIIDIRGRDLCPACAPDTHTFCFRKIPLPRGEFRYGIELETSSCPGCGELDGKTCFGCKSDASIEGMEFISPPLAGQVGTDAINKFLDLAEEREFTVKETNPDRACGYHLHLNMDGRSLVEMQKIAYAYYLSEDTWRLFIREDRKDNHYCQRISWKIEDMLNCETHTELLNFINCNDALQTTGRYCWFNVVSYAKHKTFEIRSHEGTLDGEAIHNWIKLHITFCQWAIDHSFYEIEEKLSHINLDKIRDIIQDDSLVAYYANKVGLGVAIVETENQLQVA